MGTPPRRALRRARHGNAGRSDGPAEPEHHDGRDEEDADCERVGGAGAEHDDVRTWLILRRPRRSLVSVSWRWRLGNEGTAPRCGGPPARRRAVRARDRDPAPRARRVPLPRRARAPGRDPARKHRARPRPHGGRLPLAHGLRRARLPLDPESRSATPASRWPRSSRTSSATTWASPSSAGAPSATACSRAGASSRASWRA